MSRNLPSVTDRKTNMRSLLSKYKSDPLLDVATPEKPSQLLEKYACECGGTIANNYCTSCGAYDKEISGIRKAIAYVRRAVGNQ